MAHGVGPGAVEDGRRDSGGVKHVIGLAQQACGAEREVVGIRAGEHDRLDTRGRAGHRARQPPLDRVRADAVRHVVDAPPVDPPPGLTLWLDMPIAPDGR